MIERCSACDPSCRLVYPTGPRQADVLLIGEKPGQQEANLGRVFCGDTGRELDKTYLPLAGLHRAEVRITNCVKCRLNNSNVKPTPAQVLACASHWLPGEIEAVQPSVIILLGSTACSLIEEIDLERQHGLPFWAANFYGFTGWVFPSYHPAAGLHLGSVMIHLLADFDRFRKWRAGKWEPPVDTLPTDYRLVNTAEELDEDFKGRKVYHYVPVDTESDGDVPWSIQYSLRPGHGRMIMAANHALCRRFGDHLIQQDVGLLLHNAPADLGPLEAMGVRTAVPLRDSMQELYHLANLPQALKSAAYRLLGAKMRSWEDLTAAPSRQKMLNFLLDTWVMESDNRIKVEVQLKRKTKILFKPTELERTLKRLITHAAKPTYDLAKRMGEAGLSDYPIQSIAHAPMEECVQYACRDADMTGRLGSWLEQERARIVVEEWRVE